jgi:hypothetical protein
MGESKEVIIARDPQHVLNYESVTPGHIYVVSISSVLYH